jgi:hypothetical protein
MWFESGWWYQVPDLARPFLGRSREVDRHKKSPKARSRLGRGLLSLQESMPTPVVLTGLFKNPK